MKNTPQIIFNNPRSSIKPGSAPDANCENNDNTLTDRPTKKLVIYKMLFGMYFTIELAFYHY